MDFLLAFVIGAFFGSYLNVCIYRMPLKISTVSPRSFCPNCGTPIPIYLNIPLISYLFLKGQCLYCRQPISARYFWVELISAIVTVATYYKFGISANFFFYITFIYFLVVISFIDLSVQLIYNRILLYLLSFGIVYNIAFQIHPWIEALLGLVSGGCSLLFFAVLGQFLFKKESMGMGDIKLASVLGFFLGWKLVLFALFFGFFFALFGGAFLMLSRRSKVDVYLPMAPFLTLGTLLFLYWGPLFIKWYWNFFLPVR